MRKNKYIKPYLDNFFLLSYSDLFRVSMDPRVKPEGDGRKMVPEGDERGRVPEGDRRGMVPEGDGRGRVLEGDRKKSVPEGVGKKCAPEGNFSLLSSLRAVTRGQAIFELGNNTKESNRKIPRIFLQSRKIGMTMMMWILVSSLTMTNTVHAECVPTPDCASIGYTSTSCEGGFVRCPFDISKLYCVPCDSSYQYTCSGTGQVGSGDSCNGKYVSCDCADGYELVDGNCVVSCSYTRTSLPTGCSAVSGSCVKNGTTYYSSTCTSCKTGYTLSSGSCNANTCDGYHDYNTGCTSYTTCQSGSITKYKCTACEEEYILCENTSICIDTDCYTSLIGNIDSCTKFRFDYCNEDYSCYGNYGEVYTAIPSTGSSTICGSFGGGPSPF